MSNQSKQLKLTLSPQLFEQLRAQADYAGLTPATYLRLLVVNDVRSNNQQNNQAWQQPLTSLDEAGLSFGRPAGGQYPPQIVVVNNDGASRSAQTDSTGVGFGARAKSARTRFPSRAKETVKLNDVLKMI